MSAGTARILLGTGGGGACPLSVALGTRPVPDGLAWVCEGVWKVPPCIQWGVARGEASEARFLRYVGGLRPSWGDPP